MLQWKIKNADLTRYMMILEDCVCKYCQKILKDGFQIKSKFA